MKIAAKPFPLRRKLLQQDGETILNELMQMPEQNIPTWLLERAHAVAVIPAVIKVGLGVGGRRGSCGNR